MNYKFPLINNISDVLPAIEGRDEFTVAVKDGYTVINYNVMMADTFPPVDGRAEGVGTDPLNDLYAMLRRECRGIIFDNETGRIIRRPFHKFFNVNEREETQDYRINLSQGHAILEKLDGSMIAPFIVNGQMIWGTKMGATEVAKPVELFICDNLNYLRFADDWIKHGYTPIFEWCSRKQRIVLDYAEDQLILTAMRNLYTGEYICHDIMESNAAMYNIPVVRAFEPQTDMKAFIEYTAGLENTEGFVVRFDDGHMVKLKSHWYVQIHKAKEAILQDRNIVQLILEEHLDDVKPHLTVEDRDRLTKFENDFNQAFNSVVNKIMNAHLEIQENVIDRKTFALTKAQDYDGYIRPLLFRMFGGDVPSNLSDLVADVIRNNLGKTVKYEAIRNAWFPGVVFNN